MLKCFTPLLLVGLLFPGCSYRYYAEDLKPLSEADQGANKTVTDDGTVSYTQARLEISLRPMTDEELNRQFGAYSNEGADSRNPYTFGNSTYFRTGDTPQRFTVFRIYVSNYEYPKVYLDPKKVYITTSNGRKYYALRHEQLKIYYRRYVGSGSGGNAPGMSGNALERLERARRHLAAYDVPRRRGVQCSGEPRVHRLQAAGPGRRRVDRSYSRCGGALRLQGGSD